MEQLDSEALFFENIKGLKDQLDHNIKEKSIKLKFAFENISDKENPFEFIEIISNQGIKLVQRVFDKRSNREVVYATLSDQNNKENYQYSIINDAWVTSLLEHPNIPPIYEVGLNDNKPYFTMKFLKGKTLTKYIEDSDLSFSKLEKDIIEILLHVCDAVAFAHSKGILHLDIKADNIYINSFNEVLLFDWGCALDFDHGQTDSSFNHIKSLLQSSRQEGGMRGTPSHMSPEQAKGEMESISPRTDIFLIGSLLYYLITKETLYGHVKGYEKFDYAEAGQFRSVLELNSKCSKRLNAILSKCLMASQDERYQSIDELSNDLKGYLNDDRISIEKPNLWLQSKIILRKYPRVIYTTIFLLFIFSLLTLVFAWFVHLNEKDTSTINKILIHSNKKQEKLLKHLSSISSISELSFQNVLFEENNLFQMETLLIFQPQNPDFWFDKGRILCGEFKFFEAQLCFDKSYQYSDNNNQFRKQKSLEMKQSIADMENIDISHEWSTETLLEHIVQMKDQKTRCLMFRFVYTKVLNKQNDKIDFLKLSLKALNRDPLDHISIKVINKEVHVDLSKNENLRNISSLFYFPATTLNLSNTPVNRLYALINPELKKLNISKTNINNLSLLSLLSLTELKINHILVSYFDLKSLPHLKNISMIETEFLIHGAISFLKMTSNIESIVTGSTPRIINKNLLLYLSKIKEITFPIHKRDYKTIHDSELSHINFKPLVIE